MLLNVADRQSHQDTILSQLKYLDFYAGTRPSDIAGISLGTKLGRATFGSTPFGNTNSSGVATANAITGESSAIAAGTCTYVVGLKTDGTTIVAVWGAGDAGDAKECVLNNKVVAVGATIAVSSLTNTWGVGTI